MAQSKWQIDNARMANIKARQLANPEKRRAVTKRSSLITGNGANSSGGLWKSIHVLEHRIDTYHRFVGWPALEQSLRVDLDRLKREYKDKYGASKLDNCGLQPQEREVHHTLTFLGSRPDEEDPESEV